MRRLVVSINITLDGYMAGPDRELDWHSSCWTPEMGIFMSEQLSKADTILLGRVTFMAMSKYWPGKSGDLTFPRDDIAFAYMMNYYDKVVFSRTVHISDWNNSRFVSGNLQKEILKLKRGTNGHNKNIILYGSGELVSSLMQEDLIDDYLLWLHPVILGEGKLLFREIKKSFALELREIKTFDSGVVVLSYSKNH